MNNIFEWWQLIQKIVIDWNLWLKSIDKLMISYLADSLFSHYNYTAKKKTEKNDSISWLNSREMRIDDMKSMKWNENENESLEDVASEQTNDECYGLWVRWLGEHNIVKAIIIYCIAKDNEFALKQVVINDVMIWYFVVLC